MPWAAERLFALVILSVLGVSRPAAGQSGQPVVNVQIDGSGQAFFMDDVPFDVPFIISGRRQGMDSVSVTYHAVSNTVRQEGYWEWEEGGIDGNAAWKRAAVSGDVFLLPIRRLSSGYEYAFHFELVPTSSPGSGTPRWILRCDEDHRRCTAALDPIAPVASSPSPPIQARDTVRPIAKISPERSPFTAADVGAAFLPDRFGFQPVFFLGANFHFGMPVNQSTPPGIYRSDCNWGFEHWRDCLRKLLSIHLALAVTEPVGANDDNPYEKLWNAGSPMLGLGMRVKETTRVQAGIIFFEQPSENPLSEPTTAQQFYVSGSTDLILSGVINTLRGLLLGL